MKYLVFITVLIFSPFLFAEPDACDKNIQSNEVAIKVNGMVCDFCARSLEKTFGKRDEVKSIDVDLDAGNVRVALAENRTLDDVTLQKLIKDSGYDLVGIQRACPK